MTCFNTRYSMRPGLLWIVLDSRLGGSNCNDFGEGRREAGVSNYRLPNGDTARDVDEYIAEWHTLAGSAGSSLSFRSLATTSRWEPSTQSSIAYSTPGMPNRR